MRILSPRGQYVCACGLTYAGLAVLAIGAASPTGCVMDLNGPLRYMPAILPTMLLLVTSLAWLTEIALNGGHHPGRALVWSIGSFVFFVLVQFWATRCFVDTVANTTDNFWQILLRPPIIIIILLVIFFTMFVVAGFSVPASRDDSDNELSPRQLERWGKIAALIIMMLALFAYGLKSPEKGDSLRLTVNWAEVPAILIVFVLAELGIGLVVASMNIDRQVRDASSRASIAVDKAERLTITSNEAAERQALLNQQFTNVTSIANILGSVCYEASMNILSQFGIKASESKEYWDKLGTFVNSWNTGSSQEPGTQKLLRVLFESYIGESVIDGSVRIKGNHSVTCVTADAVFVDASKRWLVETQEAASENETVVVWAVSKLLPTEFAFPGLWYPLDSESAGEESARVQHLEGFISAVINSCKAPERNIEYRRVTVVGSPLGAPKLSAPKLSDFYNNSVENWMLWDPRVSASRVGGLTYENVEEYSYDFIRAFLRWHGETTDIDRYPTLTRNRLMALCVDNAEAMRARRMLPLLTNFDVRLFKTKFGDWTAPGGKLERIEGLVLGASDLVLSGTKIGKEDIGSILSNVESQVSRKFIEMHLEEITRQGATTAKMLLRSLNWMSLKEWYCSTVHTGTGSNWDAFWALKNEPGETEVPGFEFSPFDDGFFRDLRLDWNGTPVLTLDALLVGLRTTGGGDDRIRWSGAVVSNLSLTRTECTVQLKTDPQQLRSIADVIGKMCSSASGFSGRWENGIAFDQRSDVVKLLPAESTVLRA